MQLYDNAYPSVYEEIKTWYPVWYRDVLEMDALWRVWGGQLDAIQAGIIQAVNNNFIDYADARTIGKLEAFLGITYDGPRTLVERRAVVKAFVLGNGHIGEREIKELIGVFTSGEIAVAFINGTIAVTVTRDLGDRFQLVDCMPILKKRIPAHLGLGLTDKVLPIPFENDEHFIFISLKSGHRFTESTAIASGARLDGQERLNGTWLLNASYSGVGLVNFGARMVFLNKGDTHWGRRLDGLALLDGTWNLEASHEGIFNGLSVKALSYSPIPIANKEIASGDFLYYARAKERQGRYKLLEEKLAGTIGRNIFGFAPQALGFSKTAFTSKGGSILDKNFNAGTTLSETNSLAFSTSKLAGVIGGHTYGFSGKITADGRWPLNGSRLLNGTRTLNAIYYEEDL